MLTPKTTRICEWFLFSRNMYYTVLIRMIGKLIKGIGIYKDGKGVIDNPEEGVADIAFDLTLKPFLVLISIILILVLVGSFIFGIIGGIGFLKVVFWIAFVLFVLVRVVIHFIKRMIRSVSRVSMHEGRKIIGKKGEEKKKGLEGVEIIEKV